MRNNAPAHPRTRFSFYVDVYVARLGAVLLLAAVGGLACAGEQGADLDLDGPEMAGGGENASNPLAAVSNTDVRWQYLDDFVDSGHLNDYFVDGAFMVNPKLKVKYEVGRRTIVTTKNRSNCAGAGGPPRIWSSMPAYVDAKNWIVW